MKHASATAGSTSGPNLASSATSNPSRLRRLGRAVKRAAKRAYAAVVLAAKAAYRATAKAASAVLRVAKAAFSAFLVVALFVARLVAAVVAGVVTLVALAAVLAVAVVVDVVRNIVHYAIVLGRLVWWRGVPAVGRAVKAAAAWFYASILGRIAWATLAVVDSVRRVAKRGVTALRQVDWKTGGLTLGRIVWGVALVAAVVVSIAAMFGSFAHGNIGAGIFFLVEVVWMVHLTEWWTSYAAHEGYPRRSSSIEDDTWETARGAAAQG